MAVDGLVVVHAAGHQNLRLFQGEVFELFPVQQLAELHGIAAPGQLRLQKQDALVLPHHMLIQNQKIQCHGYDHSFPLRSKAPKWMKHKCL